MSRILSLWLPNWPHPASAAGGAGLKSLSPLARWCERFSPLVGFAGDGESADLLLDITGIGPLFGGEEQLAEQIRNGGPALASSLVPPYMPRIAIADTIGAAWGLCHYQSNSPFIIHHSAFIISSLAPLPIEALRLPDETIGLLHQLGVVRIEELLRLPRAGLSSRFADAAGHCPLLTRLDQASGAAAEVIAPYRPAPEFRAEWALEHPVEQRAAVERILEDLAERVAKLLAARRQGAVRLECRLDCAGGKPLSIEVGLFRPSAEPRYLLDLLAMQLEQTWPGPVGRVVLQVPLAAPLADRQQELFPDESQEADRRLALLIDRLSGRLGREAVLRPRLVSDAQPERACRYTPLVGRRATTKRKKTEHGSVLPALARPLQLFSSPLPLEVLGVSPDGPPVQFTYQRRLRQVVRHWGPERIETGWWRGRCVRRDYYRVETSDGCRFWLFRRLDDNQWFLQGSFT